jgi:hypothetical protein
MTLSENDVVRLTKAHPEHGFSVGAKGTIAHVFDRPTRAYEVEFCDTAGRTIAQFAVESMEIEPAIARQTA